MLESSIGSPALLGSHYPDFPVCRGRPRVPAWHRWQPGLLGGIQIYKKCLGFLRAVLLSTLSAQAEMAQRLPRKTAAMLIRPRDHQSLLIPHDKPVLLLPLLGYGLFRHVRPLSQSG